MDYFEIKKQIKNSHNNLFNPTDSGFKRWLWVFVNISEIRYPLVVYLNKQVGNIIYIEYDHNVLKPFYRYNKTNNKIEIDPSIKKHIISPIMQTSNCNLNQTKLEIIVDIDHVNEGLLNLTETLLKFIAYYPTDIQDAFR